MDHLAFMMLSSPTFKDKLGYFQNQNLETVFYELNEGLAQVRRKIGQQRYETMRAASDQMRTHFEADPEDANGRAREGRKLVLEMREMLSKRGK
ncbi:MAG: hypothetical protein R3C25_07985 [Hyphomonadaceae bacterium]